MYYTSHNRFMNRLHITQVHLDQAIFIQRFILCYVLNVCEHMRVEQLLWKCSKETPNIIDWRLKKTCTPTQVSAKISFAVNTIIPIPPNRAWMPQVNRRIFQARQHRIIFECDDKNRNVLPTRVIFTSLRAHPKPTAPYSMGGAKLSIINPLRLALAHKHT